MVYLSLIWIFSWVTIIFGPPVTFAYYFYAQKMVDETYPETSEIVEAGKRYFTQSWQWMLANILVILLLFANFVFYDQLTARWADLVKTIFVALGFLWLGVQFYALPYYMLQEEKSLRTAWRNGLYTFFAAPVYTLTLWVFAALIAALSAGTVIPILLGMPGIIVVLGSKAVFERLTTFKIIEEDPDTS
jgi:uncharacterized membrane protein YesL